MRAGGLRLRGTRPWTNGVVVEPDETREPVAVQHVRYDCPHGHQLHVTFADRTDVEVPAAWPCTAHGTDCSRPGAPAPTTAPAESAGRATATGRAGRTPWDMLIERRTIPELESLLDEALAKLRAARRT